MLRITIPAQELYNEKENKIISTKETTLQLEHSLVSISKWEARWCKPFISENGENNKSVEETLDYIKCMTITQNVDPKIYNYLTAENIKDINAYIERPSTATIVKENIGSSTKKQFITSELIYYWMIANEIPIECEKWHLNRLLTLIRVCSSNNNPSKKMSQSEILQRNSSLNKTRRAARRASKINK